MKKQLENIFTFLSSPWVPELPFARQGLMLVDSESADSSDLDKVPTNGQVVRLNGADGPEEVSELVATLKSRVTRSKGTDGHTLTPFIVIAAKRFRDTFAEQGILPLFDIVEVEGA